MVGSMLKLKLSDKQTVTAKTGLARLLEFDLKISENLQSKKISRVKHLVTSLNTMCSS